MMVGGVVGILFQLVLGRAIDHFGEKTVLMSEASLLVFVCLGYGFGKSVVPERVAFYIASVCFLLDQMLMSVNMARSTYIRKIVLHPTHIQPALTASVTIDHVFSITLALVGGVIWNAFGFQYVFLLGAVIALGNLAAASRIRVPEHHLSPVAEAAAVQTKRD
jgi:predicted MFS family arabinose efflux permease